MAEAVLDRSSEHAAVRMAAPPPRLALAVGLITLGGFLLRAAGLPHESLWLDEGYTLLFSHLPLTSVLTVGGAHEHPPLYYLLCHLLFPVLPSPLLPRLLSLFCGTLLIPLVFLLGQRLLAPPAGLIAALLVAVSPLAIWYSQDGRAYALATLLVTASYLLLLAALATPARVRWLLYSLCLLGCLYTEYTTVLALVPQVLLLPRSPRALLRAWLLVALGYLPWLGVLLRNTVAVAGDYWIPPPSLAALRATGLGFLGVVTPCPSPPCSGVMPAPLAPAAVPLALGVLLLLLLLLGWSLFTHAAPRLLLAAWLVTPFLVVLALAPVRSLYLDRVFVDALPAFLLLGAAGLVVLPRLLGGALLLLLVAGNLATSSLLFTTQSNPDWRSLARDLAAASRPGDAVMYNPGVLRTLVDAYLPSDWRAPRERALWSRQYVDIPGWQNHYPRARRSDKVTRARVEAVLRNRQLRAVSRGKRNVWLVSLDYSGLNDARRWFIQHGYQVRMSELYEGDTRLELWSLGPPGGLGNASVPRGWNVGWRLRGPVQIAGGMVHEMTGGMLTRRFPVRPGRLYSAQIVYRSGRGWPQVTIQLYGVRGRLLATFPRTSWFGFPVNGVWLSQPFGFVAPPGSVRAQISASTQWGAVDWRTIAVYFRR